MGWFSLNAGIKPDGEKSPDAAERGGEETPVVNIHRAELVGAAHILAAWPWQLLRAMLWIVFGAILGISCAVLLRLLIPMLLTSDQDPEHHIHMATTNLTAPRACALEALAREHSQRPCHIVVLKAHPPQTLSLLYMLKDNYPNLNTHYHPDPDDYFESSPLDGFSKFAKDGGLLDLAARTLALWRNGGVSVDLDRPVMSLPPSGQYVQQGRGALLQFPKPCHPALQGLLDSLGRDLKSSAEEAMNRATNWICRIKLGDTSPVDESHVTPKQCLGVNVLGNEGVTADNGMLQCPIVQAHHQESTTTTSEAPNINIETTVQPSSTTTDIPETTTSQPSTESSPESTESTPEPTEVDKEVTPAPVEIIEITTVQPEDFSKETTK